MIYAIQEVMFSYESIGTGRIYGHPSFKLVYASPNLSNVLYVWNRICSGLCDANDLDYPHPFDKVEFCGTSGVFYRITVYPDDVKLEDMDIEWING